MSLGNKKKESEIKIVKYLINGKNTIREKKKCGKHNGNLMCRLLTQLSF